MPSQGDLISQYIRDEMSSVTNDFISEFGDNTPTQSLINEFRSKWMNAISEGLFDYMSNEYEFNVKTNGAIALATTPPSVLPVSNYDVDGSITVFPSSVLAPLFISSLVLTDAFENMKLMFSSISTWLPKVATVTGPGDNASQVLSTVAGVGTIAFPNFISIDLANECFNETENLKFVDSEGNVIGDSTKIAWDVIGKYIYQGISGNVVTIPTVAGTANTTIVPLGTTYTGTAAGTVNFK